MPAGDRFEGFKTSRSLLGSGLNSPRECSDPAAQTASGGCIDLLERFSVEPFINHLREAEVLLARGQRSVRSVVTSGCRSRATIAGAESAAA